MKISKTSAAVLTLLLVITSGFFAYALLNPNETKQMNSMGHGVIGREIISEYALTNSKNEQILKLAQQIKSDQSNEITQMKQWLTDDGLGTDPGHSMAGMAGMLSDSQLNTLKTVKGVGFDRLFLENMIEHHLGALQMVVMIENSKVAALRDFAVAITTAQQSEIKQMQEILGN